jgi:hypothetical protein
MSNKAMLLILVCSFSFLQMDCKDDPPVVPPIDPQYKQSIFLNITDSGLTEVYLMLSITDTFPPRGYDIFRNGSKILSGSLFGNDTTLVDTTAQLNTNYLYQAFRMENAARKDSSNIVTARTLDTISHEFTFEIDTLGDGASQLYDVAIINDTLVYAVGQIYLKDSTGNWINPPYNLAKWNGKRWELLRIEFLTFCDQTSTYPYPTRSLWAFNDNNIWITSASQATTWDGTVQTQPRCLPISVLKLWGAENSKLFAVGEIGGIASYTGSGWQKIESGTTVRINDVWGGKDESGTEVVFAGVSDLQLQGEMKLLKFSPTQQVQNLDWSPQRRINTVWFWTIRKIYVGGSGLYEGVPGNWRIIDISNSFVRRIRGTSSNNVWAVGDFGLCGHFNGSTWKVFPEAYLSDGSYYGLSVNNNNVIAVGQSGNKAIVLRGRKTIY